MDGKLPPRLFFHVKGTHVHHLNYGISCSASSVHISCSCAPRASLSRLPPSFMALAWA
jgi:hypothetical protein